MAWLLLLVGLAKPPRRNTERQLFPATRYAHTRPTKRQLIYLFFFLPASCYISPLFFRPPLKLAFRSVLPPQWTGAAYAIAPIPSSYTKYTRNGQGKKYEKYVVRGLDCMYRQVSLMALYAVLWGRYAILGGFEPHWSDQSHLVAMHFLLHKRVMMFL